jgi:hypothetical protein
MARAYAPDASVAAERSRACVAPRPSSVVTFEHMVRAYPRGNGNKAFIRAGLTAPQAVAEEHHRRERLASEPDRRRRKPTYH